FRLASCALRGIAYGSSELPVLQAVFSDGLTHVSLFVEPYRAERHRGAVQARLGATSTVTRRLDEHWVTVVGDVPVATLERFAAALERRR
ncbi:MAG: transcriptional regulator, partial [Comamonadaceae bacterium]|nr:transcriptional regulator [Comamonadaceae bacterium]